MATVAFPQHGFKGVKRRDLPHQSEMDADFCGLASRVRYRHSSTIERSGNP